MILRSLLVPLCLAALATSASANQSVTVLVSGQGTPVEGVKVTLAPDTGVSPEAWNIGTSKPLAIIPTDASGHAVFKDVPR